MRNIGLFKCAYLSTTDFTDNDIQENNYFGSYNKQVI